MSRITKDQWAIAAEFMFRKACRDVCIEPTQEEVADAVSGAMDMICPRTVDASADSGVLRP